jgi:hypothetical protein
VSEIERTIAPTMFNPGTGNLTGHCYEDAEANIKVWLEECGYEVVSGPEYDEEHTMLCWRDYGPHGLTIGRYTFRAVLRDKRGDEHAVEVDMPGWPLRMVRMEDGDDPWKFPRLYTDGSSWLWPYSFPCYEDDESSPERRHP